MPNCDGGDLSTSYIILEEFGISSSSVDSRGYLQFAFVVFSLDLSSPGCSNMFKRGHDLVLFRGPLQLPNGA